MSSHTQPTNRPARSHSRGVRALGWLAVCLLAAGCGDPARPKVTLEAYSWWKRPSEQRAFDNVLRIYNSSQSRAEAVNQASETNADAARITLTARLLAGAPPSTFQANVGADLLRWTVVDTNDELVPSATRIADLSGIYARNGLEGALPGPLLQALSAGPLAVPYAVPINIHRLNLIYYNKAALAAFRARHPGQSFLDRDVLCPTDLESQLQADPTAKLDVKIAVGTKDAFALTLFALESVLPAVAGPARYDALFRGRVEADWEAPVRHALRCVQYLSHSFLDDRDKGWADALAQVQELDGADFSVMGDWANGELKAALERGDVEVQPFPGSDQIFVFTSDTFPLPIDAPYGQDSEAFLDTIASKQAQLAFSLEKGSIPARTDVDITSLGPRAELTRAAFADPEMVKLLATSGLFPPYFPDALDAKLSAMTAPGASPDAVEDVMALLRDSEPLLARWQDRIAVGPTATP